MEARRRNEFILAASKLLARKRTGVISDEFYDYQLSALHRAYQDILLCEDADVIPIYRAIKSETGRIIDSGVVQ